jgi:hypothetical protein
MTRPIELPHFFTFASTLKVIPKVIHNSIGGVCEHGSARA